MKIDAGGMTPDEPIRSMQSGLRAALRRLGGRARPLSASATMALLCAGAFSEVIGGSAAITAVLANVGANTLTDVIKAALLRVKGREEELAQSVEAALEAGGERAAHLSDDIAAVLRAIDAGQVALEAMLAGGSREITSAIGELAAESREFAFLLTSVQNAIDLLSREQLRQGAAHRLDNQQIERRLAEILLMREDLRKIADGEPATGRSAYRGCPYRGLAAFGAADSEIFFGRERRTVDLVLDLAAAVDDGGLLIVSGTSGAGKSSLLRAGLVPALASGLLPQARTWPVLLLTPGASPLEELAVQVAALGALDVAAVLDQLTHRPEQTHQTVRQALLQANRGERLILIVDQFEELFTLGRQDGAHEEEERRRFVTALHAMTENGTATAVVAFRADYANHVLRYWQLAKPYEQHHFVLGAMAPGELRSAITGPAEAAGLTWEEGFVQRVLAELRAEAGDPGALPLLSQALRRTWENREDGRLTLRAYAASGGVQGAVEESAEEVYGRLTVDQRKIAQRCFTRLVTYPGPARRAVTRRQLHEVESPAEVDAVIVAFQDARVLTADVDRVEIAHDVLLTSWPRLATWLDRDLDARRAIDRLNADAAEWVRFRARDLLYRGVRLRDLEELRPRWREDPLRVEPPDGDALELLSASRAEEDRADRVRRRVIATLAGLLAVSLVATGIAYLSRAEATEQGARALSGRLVAVSTLREQLDPNVARLLAALAARTPAPVGEAQDRLLALLTNPGLAVIPDHTRAVTSVAFTHDGAQLATAGEDGTVRRLDLATGQAGAPLRHPDRVLAVTYLPGGGRIATVGADGSLRLWERTSGRLVGRFPLGPLRLAAFSPGGDLLATSNGDHRIRLWDPSGNPRGELPGDAELLAFTQDSKRLAAATGGKLILWDLATRRSTAGFQVEGMTALAFSPDGTRVATGEADHAVQLRDAITGEPVAPALRGHTERILGLAFTRDGSRLISGSFDTTARLWAAGVGSRRLADGMEAVSAVAYSPAGTHVATVSDDKALRIWKTGTGSAIRIPLSEGVLAVAFSQDGGQLATVGDNGAVRLWETATGRPTATPHAPSGPVTAAGFSGDGTRVAIAGQDGTVLLMDTTTGRSAGQVPVGFPPTAIAVASDGTRLAAASGDLSVRLVDPATGRQRPIGNHTGTVNALAFNHDGTRLVSGSSDRTAQLWEVGTGKHLQTFSDHRDGVMSADFSDDGTLLALASDRTAQVWDVRALRPHGLPLTGHIDPLTSVSFSHDGKHLVTGGWDRTARLWDTPEPVTDPRSRVCAQVLYREVPRETMNDLELTADQARPCG